MAKLSSDEGKKAILDSFINANLFAFLIDDPGNTIDGSSSMAGAAALEIIEGNGYTRKAVVLPNATIRTSPTNPAERIATAIAPTQSWLATGTIPNFTKICYAKGTTNTRGAAAGTLIRVEHALHDAQGQPVTVSLLSGQSYRHTATFEVGGIVT